MMKEDGKTSLLKTETIMFKKIVSGRLQAFSTNKTKTVISANQYY